MLSCLQAAPGTPTNVEADVVGPSLFVSWNEATAGDVPTGNRLDFFSGSNVVQQAMVGPVTSASFTIPPGVQGTFGVTVTALAGMTAGSPSSPATFTIGGGGCTGPPPIPTGLTGTLVSGLADVRWNVSPGATGYLVQAGSGEGRADSFNGNVGNNTRVTSPGLPPDFQAFIRVFAENPCGRSGPTTPDFLLRGAGPGPTPTGCVPGPNTICAFDRFKIEVNWRTTSGFGPATVAPGGRYNDGGEFWFFNPNNIDLLVKVLNSCSSNNRFWVFASGQTSAEVVINVTDTQRGGTREYLNPIGQPFRPIQDTDAFATCP